MNCAKKENCNTNSKLYILLGIIIFLTNISQLPSLIEFGGMRVLSIVPWIVFSFIVLVSSKICIRIQIEIKILFVLIWLIIIQGLLLELSGRDYLRSDIPYAFFLSMFILIISYISSSKISQKQFEKIIYIYIVSGCAVAISVYINFFAGKFNWNSIAYAYTSKNSISQILLTLIILLFIYYKPQKNYQNVIKWVSLILLVILLFMLKSRAAILGFFSMGVISLFFSKYNKQAYKIIISILIITIIVFISNQDIFNLFVNNILLGNRDIHDLNSISSGRIEMLVEFPKLFSENFILGSGNIFIESFPLCTLVELGIIGGPIMIFIAMYPIICSIFKFKTKSRLGQVFLIISISYFINGIFEQLAPFGPGVKNYMLWLMFGLMLGWSKNKNMDKVED